MMGICGECGSEEEHAVINLSMGLAASYMTIRCKCGHEWDEVSEDPEIGHINCKNCEGV